MLLEKQNPQAFLYSKSALDAEMHIYIYMAQFEMDHLQLVLNMVLS